MHARTQRREYADALGRPMWVHVHGGTAGPSDNRWDAERGLIEEHRYDALGRQVLVWQRRELLPTPPETAPSTFRSSSCIYEGCESAVVRTVWAGDQALYEIRTSANDSTAHLDQVAETDRPPTDLPGERGSSGPWGLTLNVYGDALDAPLAVIRGWDATATATPHRIVFPHFGWRGMPMGGTTADGAAAESFPWIGRTATLDHQFSGVPGVSIWRWSGTRLADGKEASGLLNRRNRFYDPRTARFTSVDPIGLAGGPNIYAFVGGDPLSFDDPDGLHPILAAAAAALEAAAIRASAAAATRAAVAAWEAAGGAALARGVWSMPHFLRGSVLSLANGENLARNFRTVDRWVTESARLVSIKSLDVSAARYQAAGALERTLNGYISALSSFSVPFRNGAVEISGPVEKVLRHIVPSRGMTAAQFMEFHRAREHAERLGITVELMRQ